MTTYLLDSDICIFALRGSFDLHNRIKMAGRRHCCVSEITVAELKYGAVKSGRTAWHRQATDLFLQRFEILSIFDTLDIFASEKVRLEKRGQRLDDFDLLIGSTAIRHDLTLVTNNVKHFRRMANLRIENWTA